MKGTDKMKVGDYIITKDRLHIGKIYNINDFREPSTKYVIDFPNADDFIFMGEEDFISSPDIIDLIQSGDYINGIYIDTIEKEQKRVWHTNCYGDDDIVFYNNDIKSIVTKEQFSQMEYKVGE